MINILGINLNKELLKSFETTCFENHKELNYAE